MTKKFRKGSMGAADERTAKLVLIVFSVIFAVIYSLFFFDIGGNFFHDYFLRASPWSKIVGIVLIGVQYFLMWVKLRDWNNETGSRFSVEQYVLYLLTAVIMAFLGGFDFGL